MDKGLNNYTCCFTGHRKIPKEEYLEIKNLLKKEIINLISRNVKYFGSGGALGFDTLAALTVLDLKAQYPFIKLILVLPCPEQAKLWNQKDIETYEHIKSQADKIVYTSDKYSPNCMFIRNRHLVDNSKYCICYLSDIHSGTGYTVNYAFQKNKKIINLKNFSIF